MGHSATINIGVGNQKQEVLVTFEDDEWNCLVSFLDYCDQLQKTKICTEGAPGGVRTKYEQGVGWSYETDLPPDDDFIALLHRLRPFLLNDEPTNFYKVVNLLSRRIEADSFRGFIKRLKHFYSGKRFREMISITSNDVAINSEETLMKWLNAHEYHKDRDKQKELEDLHKIFPLDFSRAIFVTMIYDMVKAIFGVAGIVSTLAGKQQEFRCTGL